MKKVKKIAISGILTALSVVIMSPGSLVESLDMTLAAIAGFCTLFASIELKKPYPQLIFASTSLLALLLLPNKYGALVYIFIYGYYPIIKFKLDALKISKPLIFAVKFVIFAAAVAATELCALFVLGLPKDESLGKFTFILLIAAFEFSLFIYDALLRILTYRYFASWRNKIEKFLK